MKFKFLFLGILVAVYCLAIISAQVNNESNETEIVPLEIIKFFPTEVREGPVQLNIQVKNNLDVELNNLFAIVKGRGFSTYDVIPIDSLASNGRDYIFVSGYFAESGEINLTIYIEDSIFIQKISVIDVTNEDDSRELLLKKLNELILELDVLKKNYTDLEIIYSEKKVNNYDVSTVKLEDLKKFIRDAESGILSEDVESAEVNLRLAKEEYDYQKNKLANARVIPIIMRLREGALIFSTIIGAVLAFFALSELLKRKGESVVGTVRKIGSNKKSGKKKSK